MTKFNIIGNPPYIGKGEKFYLRVMSECEKFADSAVWIVPTDFVDNPRIKENINNKHIAILNERFESFDRIETVIGDAKFDEAAFFSDVGIFVFNDKKRDLYDLRYNRFSDPEKYKEITEIVDAYLVDRKTIGTEQGKKNTWYIQLSEIRGHRRCWDWPTLLSKERYESLSQEEKDKLSSLDLKLEIFEGDLTETVNKTLQKSGRYTAETLSLRREDDGYIKSDTSDEVRKIVCDIANERSIAQVLHYNVITGQNDELDKLVDVKDEFKNGLIVSEFYKKTFFEYLFSK